MLLRKYVIYYHKMMIFCIVFWQKSQKKYIQGFCDKIFIKKGGKAMIEKKEQPIINESKKTYQKPIVKAVDISEALMVAASKSGMGQCKITFV